MARPKIGDCVILLDDPKLPEKWRNTEGIIVNVDLAHRDQQTLAMTVTIRNVLFDTEITVSAPCFKMK